MKSEFQRRFYILKDFLITLHITFYFSWLATLINRFSNFQFGDTLYLLKLSPTFVGPTLSIHKIQLKPIHIIDQIKLILYPQIRNYITHLTIRHSMSSRLEFFCTTGQREAPIAAWSFLHLVHLRGRGGSSKSHSIKSLAFWSTTICSYR